MKMDIEGGEWPILANPRLRSSGVRAMVLECHPDRCPSDDPHAEVLRLLEGAGFSVSPIFRAPSGVGMLWASRP